MPYRRLQFEPGYYYHIYNRGAGRHRLFLEEQNYLYVLRRAKKVRDELSLGVIAYCLMPNHYHFLLRQDGDVPAGEFPKRLFGGYSRAVNRLYGWSGTLFEGRYKATLVGDDSYLLHLCRYIHANPVAAGLVSAPEEWPYSNYAEWVNLRPGTLWDSALVDKHYPDRDTYRAFVREYLLDRESLPEDIREYLERFQ